MGGASEECKAHSTTLSYHGQANVLILLCYYADNVPRAAEWRAILRENYRRTQEGRQLLLAFFWSQSGSAKSNDSS